jgi:hypothetical protein
MKCPCCEAGAFFVNDGPASVKTLIKLQLITDMAVVLNEQ